MKRFHTKPRKVPAATSDPRVNTALTALRALPGLRPRALAKLVGLSPCRLKHLFKQEVGLSTMECAMELRLEAARERLVGTAHSIKQIRQDVGIPDAANFIHFFKRRFAVTPSEFRRMVRKPCPDK